MVGGGGCDGVLKMNNNLKGILHMRERIAEKRIKFLENQEIKRVVHTYAGRICAKRSDFLMIENSLFSFTSKTVFVYMVQGKHRLYIKIKCNIC